MNFQYITNEKGRKTSVILPMRDFKKLMESWEDLEDIKAYDLAKARNDEFVDWETAKAELKANGKLD